MHSDHGGFWVKGRDDAEGKFLEEDQEENSGDVEISISPTRTSNKSRPRTIGMGYDHGTDTLRVVFRPPHPGEDGAVYDYFGVSTAEWWRMKRTASPGRFINRVLATHEYTRVQ